jgi:hypothetical protein
MTIVSSDGFLYRWDLVTFTKKGDGSIDRNCDFRSAIFLPNHSGETKDEFKVMTVGSEGLKGIYRVYN